MDETNEGGEATVENTAVVDNTSVVTEEKKVDDTENPYLPVKPVAQEIDATKTEEKSEEGKKEGETPDDTPTEFTEVINSWKEDRETLAKSEKENSVLRDELAQLKNKLSLYEDGAEDEEDKELEGLTRSQREAKIVERHNQKQLEAREKVAQEVEKEKSFMRLSEPFFKENEATVIANAIKFDCNNLEQAVKITKAEFAVAERTAKAKALEDNRKLDASNKVGDTVVQKKPTDTKNDKQKSIRDIYHESL